ncbi:unnamed protein product [Vitrella brassicaformis CCMP3155]|uniref:Anaphase-promoting complex subunit 4 WD40 domain-containing protein n=2 Tax=Vitrella brassicaformis TaxID=1169539 RepID=A0A0G4EYF3_VITBC|nr:unnamed protein product [Vitrella brassicaformis CCMP3155]|eukprot:CEM04381.1 unnamed protein product [Vitrella brassicaformis CCMP3155]
MMGMMIHFGSLGGGTWRIDRFLPARHPAIASGGDLRKLKSNRDLGVTAKTSRSAKSTGASSQRVSVAAADEPPTYEVDPTQPITAIALAPDRRELAVAYGALDGGTGVESHAGAEPSASHQHHIALWDIRDPPTIPIRLHGHHGTIWALSYSSDGLKLASASADFTVMLWDLATAKEERKTEGKRIRSLLEEQGLWGKATAEPTQKDDRGKAKKRRKDRGGRKQQTEGDHHQQQEGEQEDREDEGGGAEGGGACEGEPLPASQSTSASRGCERMAVLRLHTNWVLDVAFDPTGKWLVSCGSDGRLVAWDTELRAAMKLWAAHRRTVYKVNFSTDGRRLASCGSDGSLCVWNVDADFQGICTLRGHIGAVHAVRFHPSDRTLVATGGEDGTVRLWDLNDFVRDYLKLVKLGLTDDPEALNELTCSPHHILKGHEVGVWYLEYSPDGRLVASGDNEGTVYVWNVSYQQPTLNHSFKRLHYGAIRGLVWQPNMTMLLTAAKDGKLGFLSVPPKCRQDPDKKKKKTRTGAAALLFGGNSAALRSWILSLLDPTSRARTMKRYLDSIEDETKRKKAAANVIASRWHEKRGSMEEPTPAREKDPAGREEDRPKPSAPSSPTGDAPVAKAAPSSKKSSIGGGLFRKRTHVDQMDKSPDDSIKIRPKHGSVRYRSGKSGMMSSLKDGPTQPPADDARNDRPTTTASRFADSAPPRAPPLPASPLSYRPPSPALPSDPSAPIPPPPPRPPLPAALPGPVLPGARPAVSREEPQSSSPTARAKNRPPLPLQAPLPPPLPPPPPAAPAAASLMAAAGPPLPGAILPPPQPPAPSLTEETHDDNILEAGKAAVVRSGSSNNVQTKWFGGSGSDELLAGAESGVMGPGSEGQQLDSAVPPASVFVSPSVISKKGSRESEEPTERKEWTVGTDRVNE